MSVPTQTPARLERGVVAAELRDADPVADWWHPVGWAADLGSQPKQVVLLGRALVIWRDDSGAPRCLRDLCVHRGTALSLGEVVDGELACAYHGWRFGGDGMCTRIPQFAPGTQIPPSARVKSFACVERYGLIWVCLGEPRADVAAFPEWDADGFRHVACEPYTWRASAARMLENFTDFGHLGWLHDGLLGSRDDLVVPPHRVDRRGHELHYELTMDVPDAEGINDTGAARGTMTNTYVVSLPYTIHLRSHYPDSGRSRVLYFAVQPVDAYTSTGYCYQSRDFDHEGDDAKYAEFQRILAEQDRPVVESQRPEQLPMDLADELHLKFDRVAVEYRKGLVALGLQP